ncbi:MAG TPA: hypothetical protein VGR73_06975 [Bryobacteraceae bacterium]|nr:hypothetical protein [Bryobacteraceae bacterium]
MLPFQLIYHEAYDFRLRGHVFPAQKYPLIRQRLLTEHIAEESDFLTPEPASDDDLLLVHEAGWIARLRDGTLSRWRSGACKKTVAFGRPW